MSAMDINVPLKVTGIIISVGLAYWRIMSSKKLKDKIDISLITHSSFPLLTTFQHRFNSINIEFTLPVNTNVFYYKGSILNTGTLDIDKVKIYKPVIISFPEGCKIIECKMLNASSNQIDIQKKVEENKLLLSWDLLKPKEHFTFELIVDSESINNVRKLEQSISISHRISDLGKVSTIDLSTVKTTKPFQIIKSYLPGFVLLFILASIGTAGLVFGIKHFIKPDIKISYELIYKATNEKVEVEYLNDSTIKINKGQTLVGKIPINNFEKSINLEPVVRIDGERYVVFGMSILFLVVVVSITTAGIKEINRELKKGKIFESLREIENKSH